MPRAALAVLLALSLPPSGAAADERLADLVEQVAPSVVNLSTSGKRQPRTYWEAVFGGPQRWESLGSGFVIETGPCLVVTNQHVVGPADTILVRAWDGREFEAEVVGSDASVDLALLRVPGCDLPAVSFGDSRALRVGEDVFAVGNPFGHGHTVTRGILSAKARSLGREAFDLFLQTDTAINPGNSGGPLFDGEGRVVGVNTAVEARAEAIGFAMPVELLRGALERLREGRPVEAGWSGMTLEDDRSGGLRVTQVFAEGPAVRAGLRSGDLLLAVEGTPVRGRAGWAEYFAAAFPGDRRDVSVQRDGKRFDVRLQLESKDAWAERLGGPEVEVAWLGVQVRHLTPDVALAMGMKRGVYVSSARRDALLAVGDILEAVNGRRIEDAKDLLAAETEARRSRTLDVRFVRQGVRRQVIQRF